MSVGMAFFALWLYNVSPHAPSKHRVADYKHKFNECSGPSRSARPARGILRGEICCQRVH